MTSRAAAAVAVAFLLAACSGDSTKKAHDMAGVDSGADLGGGDMAGCNSSNCTGVCTNGACGKCTTDMQCQMQTAGTYCGNNGVCESATCSTAGAACDNGHLCCAVASVNTCISGMCCDSADCKVAGQGCTNHVCTACASPSPSPGGTIIELYVDASEGVNASATGADQQGCRFGSITAALASLQGSGPAHIHVANTQTLNSTAGELYPIAVLPNVSIVGQGSPAPTVVVDSGQNGLQLGAGSLLSNLTIDGTGNGTGMAFDGIVVQPATSPAATPAPSIDHVTIQKFTSCGIDVTDVGALKIASGVHSTLNGEAGLCIEKATAQAWVLVSNTSTAAADLISFDANTDHGVFVAGGTLTMTGSASQSTVEVSGNQVDGISLGAPTTQASLTNVHISSNGSASLGDGVVAQAGIAVTMRGCTVSSNLQNGVHIQQAKAGTTDASSIDLGDSGAGKGGNVFQSNDSTDICIDIPSGSSKPINAQGNKFGATDCSATAGTLTHNVGACAGGVNIGIIASPSPSPSTQINVSGCTP